MRPKVQAVRGSWNPGTERMSASNGGVLVFMLAFAGWLGAGDHDVSRTGLSTGVGDDGSGMRLVL